MKTSKLAQWSKELATKLSLPEFDLEMELGGGEPTPGSYLLTVSCPLTFTLTQSHMSPLPSESVNQYNGKKENSSVVLPRPMPKQQITPVLLSCLCVASTVRCGLQACHGSGGRRVSRPAGLSRRALSQKQKASLIITAVTERFPKKWLDEVAFCR